MSLLVRQKPIPSTFRTRRPSCYWALRRGAAGAQKGRRRAGYYLKARTRGPQTCHTWKKTSSPVKLVNIIRERVKDWRERRPSRRDSYHSGNCSTTGTTRSGSGSSSSASGKRPRPSSGWWRPQPPRSKASAFPRTTGSLRYACKMATGSGKTVVMGMIIAWQVLQQSSQPQDRRLLRRRASSSAPISTIRERLQVLLPGSPATTTRNSTWSRGDVGAACQQGGFQITNWHLLPAQRLTAAPVL